MSIDRNHPDYIDLRSRIRENPSEFVAVVGAGLSRPAGLPTWSELKDHVVSSAKARLSDKPVSEQPGYLATINRIAEYSDLWDAFSELRGLLPSMAYENAIRERLTPVDRQIKGSAYDLIWRLRVKGILTFNLDTCALDAFARVHQQSTDSATAKDTARFPQFLTSDKQFVFQPHGIVSDPSTWVLTHAERTNLLGTQSYLDFMKALFQGMHLLILGFNPSDFAFTYLIQSILNGRTTTGSKHYIILPSPNPALINTLSDKGFAVIPYHTSDPDTHPEVQKSLAEILAFTPKDTIAGSVYLGRKTDIESLPTDSELLSRPLHEVRQLLNGAVASILPTDGTPTEKDVEMLGDFYTKHLRAIHLAWLVQPDSDCDLIHGYKVIAQKGRGAFGQVYEAKHLETGQQVAIKVLLPEVRHSREYLNSFRRGVRSMRILTEKGVSRMVRLIDAFEIPACIVMDYIDGPTLAEAVAWGNLREIDVALDTLVQVGEVVHTAHNLDERVLHRDLKPDNVILCDFYNKDEPPTVVVVDFDLSWHKGALELSVVHGARAQGYAAPEQTATGRNTSISTRHTAVDAFGYGMLAYFVFVGTDPRPNEQSFEGFEEKVREAIRKKFKCRWHSVAPYLAHIIRESTRDNQTTRLAFSSALEAFRGARQMIMADTIGSTNPLLLEELAALLLPESTPERFDFGRHLRISGPDPTKLTELTLIGDGDRISIAIEMSKSRGAEDNRNVAKYLEGAKERALSRLRKHPLQDVQGIIGRSQLTLTARWPLTKMVNRSTIDDVSRIMIDARSHMDLG